MFLAERFFYNRIMKKNILFCLLVLLACNRVERKNAIADLQRLSSILLTANWQVTNGTDTAYIYFSQQFDNSYSIYEYKLVQGDSSVSWRGSIVTSDDSIVWNWNNHSLWLEEINGSKANWKEKNSGENYVMQKINDSTLQVRSSSMQLMFKRTLPLSTFLIRAKYDYRHGSNLLDRAEIPPQKLKHN